MPAQTSKTPGDGSGTLSYTLASDSFDIESVYATIDATTATGPVTAELTVRDQSGVVIARKKQAATIPAGQAGSATWALRLDDEGAESAYTTIQEEGVSLPKEKILDFVGAGVTAADDPANARTTVTIAGGSGGIQFDTYPQSGEWLYIETTNAAGAPHPGYGIELRSANHLGVFTVGNILMDSSGGSVTIESDNDQINITADNWDVSVFAGHFLNLWGQSTLALNSPASIGIQSPLINIGSGAIVHDASGAGSVTLTSGRVDATGQAAVSMQAMAGDATIGAFGSATSQVQITAQASGGAGIIRHEIFGYAATELGTKPGHRFIGNSTAGAGTRFEFMDIFSGAALLRIDVDAGGTPTFHISTGAAWVADL